ncbi:hypothetical protein MNV49_000138 [Pseudohyphozyma bogoriensis]|nr:hypothetical protein MNV49_000138 [Pseudohyphozyma bogoriensis]
MERYFANYAGTFPQAADPDLLQAYEETAVRHELDRSIRSLLSGISFTSVTCFFTRRQQHDFQAIVTVNFEYPLMHSDDLRKLLAGCVARSSQTTTTWTMGPHLTDAPSQGHMGGSVTIGFSGVAGTAGEVEGLDVFAVPRLSGALTFTTNVNDVVFEPQEAHSSAQPQLDGTAQSISSGTKPTGSQKYQLEVLLQPNRAHHSLVQHLSALSVNQMWATRERLFRNKPPGEARYIWVVSGLQADANFCAVALSVTVRDTLEGCMRRYHSLQRSGQSSRLQWTEVRDPDGDHYEMCLRINALPAKILSFSGGIRVYVAPFHGTVLFSTDRRDMIVERPLLPSPGSRPSFFGHSLSYAYAQVAELLSTVKFQGGWDLQWHTPANTGKANLLVLLQPTNEHQVAALDSTCSVNEIWVTKEVSTGTTKSRKLRYLWVLAQSFGQPFDSRAMRFSVTPTLKEKLTVKKDEDIDVVCSKLHRALRLAEQSVDVHFKVEPTGTPPEAYSSLPPLYEAAMAPPPEYYEQEGDHRMFEVGKRGAERPRVLARRRW